MEAEFNILDFCPNIVDLMLQHLTIPELLLMSEISRDFWYFISTYRKFNKNVKLNVGRERNIFEHDFVVFLKSIKRDYENLEVSGNKFPKIQLISKYYKTAWKCVKISDTTFNGPTLLQCFINTIGNHLEELIINSVFIFDCDKKITMSLPLLKRLEMIDGNDSENSFVKRVSFVINGCKSLTSLKTVYSGVSIENQKNLLEGNKELKDLTLTDLPDLFFKSFQSGVNFKLETFAMRFTSSNGRYRPRPFFNQFLCLISENLKVAKLVGCIDLDILENLFKMAKLESLTIIRARNCLLQLNLHEIIDRLVISLSLKEIIFTDNLITYHAFWQIILNKAPNLNRFVVYNSSYDGQ